jgi:hypothetical protein
MRRVGYLLEERDAFARSHAYSGFPPRRNWVLHWASHVERIPMRRAPPQLLTGWVAHPRPIECSEINLGRTPKKELKLKPRSLLADFATWSAIARDRPRYRLLTQSISTRSVTDVFPRGRVRTLRSVG